MNLIKCALAAVLAIGLATAPGRAADPADLDKAIEKLDKAAKALDDARKTITDMDKLHGRVITVEGEVKILQQEIADLRRKMDAAPARTALKPDEPTTSAYRGQGRVRFINEHPFEMSVVVNGRSYRLASGAERLIPVPPGEYTYQVLQIHNAPRVRRIDADETKTFTIYAQD
ncbi:MAG TPA: hypothetical protein VM597_19710 [Gemmataceae bacterium]|jgi:hypothetical protein|nr:hypothetical protein [Gemmataceae bacterium]